MCTKLCPGLWKSISKAFCPGGHGPVTQAGLIPPLPHTLYFWFSKDLHLLLPYSLDSCISYVEGTDWPKLFLFFNHIPALKIHLDWIWNVFEVSSASDPLTDFNINGILICSVFILPELIFESQILESLCYNNLVPWPYLGLWFIIPAVIFRALFIIFTAPISEYYSCLGGAFRKET